jgi:simple sugar transport system permease protein
MGGFSMDMLQYFVTTDLRISTPILFAVLGLLFMERSGVVCVGAEGFMLIGALCGMIGSQLTGSAWLGALFAMVVTALTSLFFSYATITRKGNQVVIGAAFNFLGLGLTTTVSRAFFGVNVNPPKVDLFPSFLGLPIPVYIALALVPVVYVILFKTEVGLRIRSVGENPRAADTVGINVERVRYGTIFTGALFLGMGGSFMTLGLVGYFTENMIAGRGFIALAAVVFGKYTPFFSLLAVLIFGAGDTLQYMLQATKNPIPYQFILMIPYILSIVAVSGFVGKVNAPAASGRPYLKE